MLTFLDLLFTTFYNISILFYIILFYLTFNVLNSKNLTNFIGGSFFILCWVVFSLAYNQLELFAVLLLLAEVVVFVYLFILYLVTNQTFIPNTKNILKIIPVLFLIPVNTVLTYNYNYIYWYSSLFESTDVYSIMVYLFEFNYLTIILIGFLISIATFLIGNIVIIYYFSKVSFKTNSIFLKNQKKKKQVIKKPTLSLISRFNNNDF